MDINPGDIVKLKKGGGFDLMTVVHTCGDQVDCVSVRNGESKKVTLCIDDLEKADSAL